MELRCLFLQLLFYNIFILWLQFGVDTHGASNSKTMGPTISCLWNLLRWTYDPSHSHSNIGKIGGSDTYCAAAGWRQYINRHIFSQKFIFYSEIWYMIPFIVIRVSSPLIPIKINGTLLIPINRSSSVIYEIFCWCWPIKKGFKIRPSGVEDTRTTMKGIIYHISLRTKI